MRKWMNTTDPPSCRAGYLLQEMTLEEKVGQLHQINNVGEKHHDALRRGEVGSSLFGSGAWAGNVRDQGLHHRKMRDAQAVAVEESRLGIPLIFGRDVIHGHRTIFPIPLAQAATWSPELVEKAAAVAAAEAREDGLHWVFAPMMDVTRDPRWGRVAESPGEDPFLGARIVEAAVKGFQGDVLGGTDKVAACAKHFAGYGWAQGGRDYNSADMGPRLMREMALPPFQAAIKAGVATVMSAFQEVDGIPMTANRKMLRELLKHELGFKGFTVSDWDAVNELLQHGVAEDRAEATRMAMEAGVDMDMISNCYAENLKFLVEKGRVSPSLLDEAVQRVLTVKFQLGLFETPMSGQGTVFTGDIHPERRALAREVAVRSMVLLENDGILPIRTSGKWLLTGPLADAKSELFGTWTLDGMAEDVASVAEAIRTLPAPELQIRIQVGQWDAALSAARDCDAVIACVGEHPSRSGETKSVADLGLPPGQLEFLKALHALGKPLVAVVFAGRPLAVEWLASHCAALVYAWHPGVEGGHAVVDVLVGKSLPGGRLPISFPRSVGQIPVYYNHKPTGRPIRPGSPQGRYVDSLDWPLYPFGHGLTYTRFAYEHLEVSPNEIHPGGTVEIRAKVRNVGGVHATETVQLYLRDSVAQVSRPVKELKGFRHIDLRPGDCADVAFVLKESDLSYIGTDGKRRTDPGEFLVFVGPDSATGLESSFQLLP